MQKFQRSRTWLISWMVPFIIITLIVANLALSYPQPTEAQAVTPEPPAQPVKLIFIHHSTGENWLKDEDGGLGLALAQNNYFVSDTNYGWGPNGIGDRTDIINWPEWFVSSNTPTYMDALFNESGQHSNYTRLFDDPGGENQIIMIKSCYPNSALEGKPDDPPQQTDYLSVGGAKFIYNQLLTYFITRPDKLFVIITAPPLSDSTYAENARAFNNWLMQDWLIENNYPYQNVVIFDFYTILTGKENHHRFVDGQIEYINDRGKNTNEYATSRGDDHPNTKGNLKATEEFVPLLNHFYQLWVDSLPAEAPVEETASESPAPSPGEEQLEAAGETPSTVPTTNQPIVEEQSPTEASVVNGEDNSSETSDSQSGTGGSCPLAVGIPLVVLVAVKLSTTRKKAG